MVESEPVTVTVMTGLKLTIAVDKTSGKIAETFVFTGRYTSDGIPMASYFVSLNKDGASVGSTLTDANGDWRIAWVADKVGTFQFQAYTLSPETPHVLGMVRLFGQGEVWSPIITINVSTTGIPTITLTITVDKTVGVKGDIFTFSGSLKGADGMPITGKTVTLLKDGVSVKQSVTDLNGEWQMPWTADTDGIFQFQARVEETYSTTVTVTVTPTGVPPGAPQCPMWMIRLWGLAKGKNLPRLQKRVEDLASQRGCSLWLEL